MQMKNYSTAKLYCLMYSEVILPYCTEKLYCLLYSKAMLPIVCSFFAMASWNYCNYQSLLYCCCLMWHAFLF